MLSWDKGHINSELQKILKKSPIDEAELYQFAGQEGIGVYRDAILEEETFFLMLKKLTASQIEKLLNSKLGKNTVDFFDKDNTIIPDFFNELIAALKERNRGILLEKDLELLLRTIDKVILIKPKFELSKLLESLGGDGVKILNSKIFRRKLGEVEDPFPAISIDTVKILDAARSNDDKKLERLIYNKGVYNQAALKEAIIIAADNGWVDIAAKLMDKNVLNFAKLTLEECYLEFIDRREVVYSMIKDITKAERDALLTSGLPFASANIFEWMGINAESMEKNGGVLRIKFLEKNIWNLDDGKQKEERQKLANKLKEKNIKVTTQDLLAIYGRESVEGFVSMKDVLKAEGVYQSTNIIGIAKAKLREIGILESDSAVVKDKLKELLKEYIKLKLQDKQSNLQSNSGDTSAKVGQIKQLCEQHKVKISNKDLIEAKKEIKQIEKTGMQVYLDQINLSMDLKEVKAPDISPRNWSR
jgi:hypothetical protein